MGRWSIASVLVLGIVVALPKRGAALSCVNLLSDGPERIEPVIDSQGPQSLDGHVQGEPPAFVPPVGHLLIYDICQRPL